MADRITDVILAALRRAVREPQGLALVANRKMPGLFPATALGRQAAERACADGLLESRPGPSPAFAITDAGGALLTSEAHPREVLDDIARAVEARGTQLTTLIEMGAALQSEWLQLRRLIGRVVNGCPAIDRRRDDGIVEILGQWNAPGDCPLPELYRRACGAEGALTVGAFHDCLRHLHAEGRIYLHPWTGPLYTLPDPAIALLIGHEVAYYASRRNDQRSAA